MNPLGIAILVTLVAIVLGAQRRFALAGLIGGVLFLTQAQRIDIAGVDLFAFRLVEIGACVRVLMRRELILSRLNRLDYLFTVFIFYTAALCTLRGDDGIAYVLGWAADAILCFLAFRGLVQNIDDIRDLLRDMLILLVPYAILVIIESYTQDSVFSHLGNPNTGVLRGDRTRAIGSFRHPSLLGSLGGIFFPLYLALLFVQTTRKIAIVGTGACLGIVFASNSGGPASCIAIGIGGWLCWLLRFQLRKLRWLLGVGLLFLAMVMSDPIWYLPAKVSSITGGDGWHRSRLMERAFRDLDEWWIAGIPVEQTRDWFPYYIHGTGGADITNQFLYFGITAGLGSILLFAAVLFFAFRAVGTALTVARLKDSGSFNEYLIWALGVVLLVHIFNWIGIRYFDQTYALWYLHLACIAMLRSETTNASSEGRVTDERN